MTSALCSLFSFTALENSWIFSKRFKLAKEHDILMLLDVNPSEIGLTKPGSVEIGLTKPGSVESGDGW